MKDVDRRSARAVIRQQSKSFALAAKLLPPEIADDAVVLYAYCRRVDDAIDLSGRESWPRRLEQLHTEIGSLFAGGDSNDELLSAMRDVCARRQIPRAYLEDLIAGMAMDAAEVSYRDWADLLRYCYRVAGTVGLMMCHVMGVRRAEALVHAAHLGIAMQLTNIARDVLEDWQRGRLYLPDSLLAQHGAPQLRCRLGGALAAEEREAVAATTGEILERADKYYRSGDAGMSDLSLRCAFAVRTARHVYSRIGDRVRRQRCDPLAGRAVVPPSSKLAAVARAAFQTLLASSRLPDRAPAVPKVAIGEAHCLSL